MGKNAKDTICQVRQRLNDYEEIAMKGMETGDPVWHRARLSLVSDMRDYLSQLDQSINDEELVLLHTSRPSCKDRFYSILGMVSRGKDGFNPFQSRERGRVAVAWRQAVWRLLAREGYHSTEIGNVTGYDHATIWWGIRRLESYIETGDSLAGGIWNDLIALTR
ncbi:MAG: hypothetical protein IK076_00145 [Bacteroidales bacterium]|nr:hypothetical protein [Bacteroidales bacterium]